MKLIQDIFLIANLVLFVANTSYSQNEKSYHFGVNLNPKKTIQIFENKNLGNGKNKNNFSLSVDLYYALNNKLEIKTGINWTRLKINENDYTLNFGCDFDGSGFDPFNSFIRADYNISYIGLPLEIKVKIVGEENHLYIKGGLETFVRVYDSHNSILVECGLLETVIEENPIKKLRKLIYELNVGIGYETKFFKKKIFFEPQLEYSLNGLFDEAGITSNLTNNIKILNVGILIGVKI